MKTRNLLISLALGFGLAMAFLWALNGVELPAARAAASVLSSAEGQQSAEQQALQGGDVLTVCPEVIGTCPYTSVQAAVDAASDGDEIRVAAGIYTDVHQRDGITQVVYISKTVTIRGGYTVTNWTTPDLDANSTTLDAQGQGRVLYIIGNISPTVEGLRITGGNAAGLGGYPAEYSCCDSGGGVYIISATATISNSYVFSNTAVTGGGLYLYQSSTNLNGSAIVSNTASYVGGGLFLWFGTSAIEGNIVSGNGARFGGGMYFSDSDPTVSHNAITFNTASVTGGGLRLAFSNATLNSNTIFGNIANGATLFTGGGGIQLQDSDATLNSNTIISNTATSGYGGGLLLDYSDAILSGNVVSFNTAGYNGGGLYLYESSATLRSNGIISNAADYGGGLYSLFSDATLTNNVVADNWANSIGGGLYISYSSPRLMHTTVARNSGDDGCGVYVRSGSTVAMTNTILVSHSVGISVTSSSTVTVNGILWHNTPITISQATAAAVSVQNQYEGDPAFAADGYHITASSAAVDKGVVVGVNDDIDGEARPFGAGADLGADEWATAETLVGPSAPATLTATVGGFTTLVEVPSQAVTETVTLKYTALAPTTHGDPAGLAFAGHTFDLDAYQGGALLSSFTFSRPVTIIIHYDEADLGGLAENTLMLEYWDEGTGLWVDAACGVYDRHPGENWLAVPICHLSRFALFGEEQRKVYLPLVIRND